MPWSVGGVINAQLTIKHENCACPTTSAQHNTTTALPNQEQQQWRTSDQPFPSDTFANKKGASSTNTAHVTHVRCVAIDTPATVNDTMYAGTSYSTQQAPHAKPIHDMRNVPMCVQRPRVRD